MEESDNDTLLESLSIFKRTGTMFSYFADIFSVTVLTDSDPPQVFVSSQSEIPQSEIDEQVQELVDSDEFGYRLLEWVIKKVTPKDTPGFYSENPAADTDQELDGPVVRSDRELTVYTWGRALRKKQPDCVQRNFNAAILNGRRKGVNLKKLDGRSQEVQEVVRHCKMFVDLMNSVCKIVERDDLHTISFNCTKGRHRSAAAAELLKKLYYPNAQVAHLEL